MCDKKPDVLGVYQAERIVAKKFRNGKPLFMVKWLGTVTSVLKFAAIVNHFTHEWLF